MEIIIGILLYIAVILSFMAFGRFLKKCDEEIANMKKEKQ